METKEDISIQFINLEFVQKENNYTNALKVRMNIKLTGRMNYLIFLL